MIDNICVYTSSFNPPSTKQNLGFRVYGRLWKEITSMRNVTFSRALRQITSFPISTLFSCTGQLMVPHFGIRLYYNSDCRSQWGWRAIFPVTPVRIAQPSLPFPSPPFSPIELTINYWRPPVLTIAFSSRTHGFINTRKQRPLDWLLP